MGIAENEGNTRIDVRNAGIAENVGVAGSAGRTRIAKNTADMGIAENASSMGISDRELEQCDIQDKN